MLADAPAARAMTQEPASAMQERLSLEIISAHLPVQVACTEVMQLLKSR